MTPTKTLTDRQLVLLTQWIDHVQIHLTEATREGARQKAEQAMAFEVSLADMDRAYSALGFDEEELGEPINPAQQLLAEEMQALFKRTKLTVPKTIRVLAKGYMPKAA